MTDRDAWTLVTEAGDEETVVSRARQRLARDGVDLDALDRAGDIRVEHVAARPRVFWRLYLRREQPVDDTETSA